MTTRAILYARVSSDDRSKTGGQNLADQLRVCREYAEQRGYTINAELAEDDRGASGASFDLPQLSKVLDLARAGAFDVLIVRELDRLSRDLAKQLIVEQELKRASVAIEYVLYDFPDTPEGRLNKNLRAMLAEYEREKIKQRMMRGIRRAVKAGNVIIHGRRPYGYTPVDDHGTTTLEIVEDEARIVRHMFEWYAAGKGGVAALARHLTDMGVLTGGDMSNLEGTHGTPKTRPPGHWNLSTVHKILSNELYAGVWHYGAEDLAVEVPAIVTRELWEAAQKRRQTNKSYSRRNTKHDYLMGRRLTCAACGHKMHGGTKLRNNRKRTTLPYYSCPARDTDVFATNCPTRQSFRADYVDAAAWGWLTERFRNEKRLRQALEEQQAQREELLRPHRQSRETIEGLIAEKERERERLLDLYLAGDFPRDMLTERRARIEATLEGLYAQRDRLTDIIADQELTEETIKTVLTLGHYVRLGIEDAADDFGRRRWLIETLDVTGDLAVEGEEQVLYLHCVLGDERLAIVSTDSASPP